MAEHADALAGMVEDLAHQGLGLASALGTAADQRQQAQQQQRHRAGHRGGGGQGAGLCAQAHCQRQQRWHCKQQRGGQVEQHHRHRAHRQPDQHDAQRGLQGRVGQRRRQPCGSPPHQALQQDQQADMLQSAERARRQPHPAVRVRPPGPQGPGGGQRPQPGRPQRRRNRGRRGPHQQCGHPCAGQRGHRRCGGMGAQPPVVDIGLNRDAGASHAGKTVGTPSPILRPALAATSPDRPCRVAKDGASTPADRPARMRSGRSRPISSARDGGAAVAQCRLRAAPGG